MFYQWEKHGGNGKLFQDSIYLLRFFFKSWMIFLV